MITWLKFPDSISCQGSFGTNGFVEKSSMTGLKAKGKNSSSVNSKLSFWMVATSIWKLQEKIVFVIRDIRHTWFSSHLIFVTRDIRHTWQKHNKFPYCNTYIDNFSQKFPLLTKQGMFSELTLDGQKKHLTKNCQNVAISKALILCYCHV